jgi:hypothetical protein
MAYEVIVIIHKLIPAPNVGCDESRGDPFVII